MTVTKQQEQELAAQISSVGSGSLSVQSVSTATAFDPTGEVPEFTVRLTPKGKWDASDFLSIRKRIREIVSEALNGNDHHIIYLPGA